MMVLIEWKVRGWSSEPWWTGLKSLSSGWSNWRREMLELEKVVSEQK
jgi:hypothetical protein